jgi:hypothetical protein
MDLQNLKQILISVFDSLTPLPVGISPLHEETKLRIVTS